MKHDDNVVNQCNIDIDIIAINITIALRGANRRVRPRVGH
jgi:hypothetical protein